MDEYLKETVFCDFSDSSIVEVAEKFKSKHKNKKDLAVALFNFVRDEIHYSLGFWKKRASETLQKKTGTCTNSSNLLVALFRQVGIPAGYGVLKVKGQEYLGEIVPKKLRKYIKKESTHIYTYVYIDGRWLRCDPSSDEAFASNTKHLNQQSSLVEWDGDTHSSSYMVEGHIVSDKGPLESIDHLINRNMKLHKIIPVKIANLYVLFLRRSGKEFSTVQNAESAFRLWLWKHYPWYALFYTLL